MEKKLQYRKPCLYAGNSFELGCATGSAATGTRAATTQCVAGAAATGGACAAGAANANIGTPCCANGNGDANNWYSACTSGTVVGAAASACQTGNRV